MDCDFLTNFLKYIDLIIMKTHDTMAGGLSSNSSVCLHLGLANQQPSANATRRAAGGIVHHGAMHGGLNLAHAAVGHMFHDDVMQCCTLRLAQVCSRSYLTNHCVATCNKKAVVSLAQLASGKP